MGIASHLKDNAIRSAVYVVADSLNSSLHYVEYERFNNCYHEAKEAQIEWLEALLKKLTSIEQGHYPIIGFLGHVGRLLKEYTETYLPSDPTFIYLKYMDCFVADGILAEESGWTEEEYEEYRVASREVDLDGWTVEEYA